MKYEAVFVVVLVSSHSFIFFLSFSPVLVCFSLELVLCKLKTNFEIVFSNPTKVRLPCTILQVDQQECEWLTDVYTAAFSRPYLVMSNLSQNNCNVQLRLRTKNNRKIEPSEITKRLSLPADVQLPIELLSKLALRSPSINEDAPIPRLFRRQSLVSLFCNLLP